MIPELFLSDLCDAVIGERGLAKIEPVVMRGITIFNVTVPPEHHGKMIGNSGSTIDGLRVLMALCGKKRGVPTSLRVIAPEKRFEGESVPFTPNLDWQATWLTALCQRIVEECFERGVSLSVTDHHDSSTSVKFILPANHPKVLPDSEVQTNLRAVLKAVGMANGRKIHCELRR